jgi:hypothetical protein
VRVVSTSAVALVLLLTSRRLRAIDAFEIQVYDGVANPPGVPALELHVNHVANGLETAKPPALPMNHVTHLTLEPSIGVTEWWELGGYLQAALRADGQFDYAGIKLRSKFVTPSSFHEHVRLGVNLEVSILPESYEPDRWGTEIRPIVAWENETWLFAVNPIVDIPLAGSGFEAGPTFEPALKASGKIGGVVGLGIEYYSSFGPISGFDPVRDQQHYVYEVLDLLSVEHLELDAGVGEGLTDASNRLVFKMIVGWSFDPDPPTSILGTPMAPVFDILRGR